MRVFTRFKLREWLLSTSAIIYMDSETMGDRNVRCLSLIGCYRLRVHWGWHWLEKFGAKFWRDFWRHFSSKQWEIEIYTRRSSFPFDTRKVNTGFIWQWILTILTKFYGGYFSRFYKSLIKRLYESMHWLKKVSWICFPDMSQLRLYWHSTLSLLTHSLTHLLLLIKYITVNKI